MFRRPENIQAEDICGWRLVDTGDRPAAENMALDAAMLHLKSIDRIPDTIRFLSFNPPAALVGMHQVTADELRLDYCRRERISVNRRMTGGGAVFFDEGQLGWELIAARDSISCGPSMADLTRFICDAAVDGLKRIGVEAEFRPRNDIEVEGRKICGTGGAYENGAFLFQGTLLVDFDVETMIKALRIPVEKLLPRELDSARQRVTCLSEHLGYTPGRRMIMDSFNAAFSRALRTEIREESISEIEISEMHEQLPGFQADDWINGEQESGTNSLMRSLHRGKGGTIRTAISVDMRHRRLRSARFAGDYFCDPLRAVYDLESFLRDEPLDTINSRIKEFFEHRSPDFMGLDCQDFISGLRKALAKADLCDSGLNLTEADRIIVVGDDDLHSILAGARTLLLPYCAKLPECDFRTSDGCDECGLCGVGDAYRMAREAGLDVISITNYEHLVETLEMLRYQGAGSYIGCCCYAFMIKHLDRFQSAGMTALLLDIDNATCYELSRENEAYAGRFDGYTELDLQLLGKVLVMAGECENWIAAGINSDNGGVR